MKKLHLLIVRSYIGPFVLTFFIVMFILLMQFIWKYIDDFMGKGIEYTVIAELLIYASANLVPMALPLAVLLSSIMTFGSMAEQYELVAMKSAGLSLFRIFQPLTVFILLLALGAFYFSNNISPEANLRFRSLLWDVTEAKPTLELKEGAFYNDLDGYSIRVMDKDEDGTLLRDVLIYDHTNPELGNKLVIRAKEGTMGKSPDGQYLLMNLYNGVSYDEVGTKRSPGSPLPHIRSEFKEDIIRIDLSGFSLKRSDQELWKNHMQMLSMGQLTFTIDSLERLREKRNKDYVNYLNRIMPRHFDSLKVSNRSDLMTPRAVFDTLAPFEQKKAVTIALNLARNAKNYIERTHLEMDNRDKYIAKHKVEWNRKLTLSFACIILFFIGAPLGAIIKKGGLGMPVLFAVIFFLVYHIISMTGEKMAGTGVVTPEVGMWLSSMVLFPISIFLTYKAANEAAVFDPDTYTRISDWFKKKFKNNPITQ